MAADRSRLTNWRVYVVTDLRLARRRSHVDVARAAVAGGADVIQLRDKHAGGRALLDDARAIGNLCRAAGADFVVNDRIDVALAAGAKAVHVGQDDLPCRAVRRLVGDDMIVGVSARDVDQARRAADDGADYLGVGPIFDATATKPDADPPCGLDGLRAIRAAVDLPIVAIGGIDHANAASVIAAGADGVAVVSCVVAAEDVERATRELRATLLRAD